MGHKWLTVARNESATKTQMKRRKMSKQSDVATQEGNSRSTRTFKCRDLESEVELVVC